MDRNLTARFGVSRETAKDFMLAFGRALHSDNFRVSLLNSNILKPFRKTLHSTLLLYAVFRSLPEKRGRMARIWVEKARRKRQNMNHV